MIDACEFCGTFQRVTIEKIEENGDAHVVCGDCLSLFQEEQEHPDEDIKPVEFKKFKWREVPSV